MSTENKRYADLWIIKLLSPTLKPRLKLIFNSPILIKVSNWDLKRAPDRLKLQKMHFSSGPSDIDVTITWTHFIPKR